MWLCRNTNQKGGKKKTKKNISMEMPLYQENPNKTQQLFTILTIHLDYSWICSTCGLYHLPIIQENLEPKDGN